MNYYLVLLCAVLMHNALEGMGHVRIERTLHRLRAIGSLPRDFHAQDPKLQNFLSSSTSSDMNQALTAYIKDPGFAILPQTDQAVARLLLAMAKTQYVLPVYQQRVAELDRQLAADRANLATLMPQLLHKLSYDQRVSLGNDIRN